MSYPAGYDPQPFYPYPPPVGAPTRAARPLRYEIIHVTGRNGAEALQMAPDSQALLLDDTAPLVWLCQTDGAGYKTMTPYTITPYQEPTPVSMDELSARLARLEEMLSAKPDADAAKPAGKARRADTGADA